MGQLLGINHSYVLSIAKNTEREAKGMWGFYAKFLELGK